MREWKPSWLHFYPLQMMLLCYMQSFHDTCRYQECSPNAEKFFLKLPMTESGIQQYTNIALTK